MMTIKKDIPEGNDTRWREKGGGHRCPIPEPHICTACGGSGIITLQNGEDQECPKCQGTGEIWE